MNKIEYIYNVYKNVLDMLIDRGYIVPKSINLSFKSFTKKYIKQDYNFVLVHKVKKHKISVIFNLNNKNKLQNIKQLLIDTYENLCIDKDEVLIILNQQPNNIIKKFIQSSIYKNKVDLFWLSILQINIIKHTLQPKFTLLNEDEKEALLDKYNIKINQLPKMSMQDPICKYYKFPKYSVVKIVRNTRQSISSEFYRYIG